jgi:hypothetical protein
MASTSTSTGTAVRTSKLDEHWKTKYTERYHALRSDASTPSPATPAGPSTASTSAQADIEEQMRTFIASEVAAALQRFRTRRRFWRVRWALGALAATSAFRHPLPLTGMALLFNASRAAEAVGFEQLDDLVPYSRVGKDWVGASLQHVAAPRTLNVLHAICTPVFGVLHRLDDPLIVGALYAGFGFGVIAARHCVDGLIGQRSVQHMVDAVERAAVEQHMAWVQQHLLSVPQTRDVVVAGAAGDVATTDST